MMSCFVTHIKFLQYVLDESSVAWPRLGWDTPSLVLIIFFTRKNTSDAEMADTGHVLPRGGHELAFQHPPHFWGYSQFKT